jgi:Peptidase C39 family
MFEGLDIGGLSSIGLHTDGYLCGPQALKNLLITLKAKPKQIKIADDARSGPHGFSLTQLAGLADKTGFKYKLIKREPGQPVPVPSVVNWNVHHFAAITATTSDGKYVLTDPTFADGGHELSRKTIDAEASGYFLVPATMDVKKNGWRVIDTKSKEAQEAYGMGMTNNSTGSQNKPCDTPANGGTSGNSTDANSNVLVLRNTGNGAAPAQSCTNCHAMSACIGQCPPRRESVCAERSESEPSSRGTGLHFHTRLHCSRFEALRGILGASYPQTPARNKDTRLTGRFAPQAI